MKSDSPPNNDPRPKLSPANVMNTARTPSVYQRFSFRIAARLSPACWTKDITLMAITGRTQGITFRASPARNAAGNTAHSPHAASGFSLAAANSSANSTPAGTSGSVGTCPAVASVTPTANGTAAGRRQNWSVQAW